MRYRIVPYLGISNTRYWKLETKRFLFWNNEGLFGDIDKAKSTAEFLAQKPLYLYPAALKGGKDAT